MFVCSNCNYQFSYKESLSRSWAPRVGIICPNCNEKQYYTAESRKKGFWGFAIMVPVFILFNSFNVPSYITLSIASLLVLITYLASPFIYDLTSEEEPLW
ncbi:hypothetical protein CEY16_01345 [Halalkalibacillus sediminis]|uniref:CXXC-20-CXXC protein n=1 Tax=Halalkalibacillus sediminis TaxID=2018042 RepID=A0A2I0QWG1_9BACI|nr:hypothetical protein CEY16_01345 [Halalkalibacillus sediminis]